MIEIQSYYAPACVTGTRMVFPSAMIVTLAVRDSEFAFAETLTVTTFAAFVTVNHSASLGPAAYVTLPVEVAVIVLPTASAALVNDNEVGVTTSEEGAG